jgi:hypothetical protein
MRNRQLQLRRMTFPSTGSLAVRGMKRASAKTAADRQSKLSNLSANKKLFTITGKRCTRVGQRLNPISSETSAVAVRSIAVGHRRPLDRRKISECCRWVLPSVLTLTGTKRLLGKATGAGPNGGCLRYCGHRASETRLPPRHRPLPLHLDWWYMPKADGDGSSFHANNAGGSGLSKTGPVRL